MNLTLYISESNMAAYSNPADLRPDWKLTHCVWNDDEIVASNPDALIVDAITPVTAELIAKLPNLKLIHSQGVAFDRIDCQAAKERGIYVCNNAGVNAVAVAEHGVMLILATLRKLVESQEAVFAGKQEAYKLSCFGNSPDELYGKKVGIIGFGAIGRELAKRLAAFGCELYYNDVFRAKDESLAAYMERDEILKQCDIISLHVPVLPSTEKMINDETLAMMKPDAILLNTARGALIDDEAVKRALTEGRLGAYVTDTLYPEPVTLDNPLLNLEPQARARVVYTPHTAGLTSGSFKRTYRNIWTNVALVEDGQRPNFVVNGL